MLPVAFACSVPCWQSAPLVPSGQRQRKPGPVLLARHVPPDLHGLVSHTGRSQNWPPKPGGQLQNQAPVAACSVHTASFWHGCDTHAADSHSTTSRPDHADDHRLTAEPNS